MNNGIALFLLVFTHINALLRFTTTVSSVEKISHKGFQNKLSRSFRLLDDILSTTHSDADAINGEEIPSHLVPVLARYIEVKGSNSDKPDDGNPNSKVSAAVINREVQIVVQGILPPLGSDDNAPPRYSTRDANEMSLYPNVKTGDSYPVTSSFKAVLDTDNKKSSLSAATGNKSRTHEAIEYTKDTNKSVDSMLSVISRAVSDRDDARKQQQIELLEVRRDEMKHKRAELELKSNIARKKVSLDLQNAQITIVIELISFIMLFMYSFAPPWSTSDNK